MRLNRWSSESHVSLLRHGRVATEVGKANTRSTSGRFYRSALATLASSPASLKKAERLKERSAGKSAQSPKPLIFFVSKKAERHPVVDDASPSGAPAGKGQSLASDDLRLSP